MNNKRTIKQLLVMMISRKHSARAESDEIQSEQQVWYLPSCGIINLIQVIIKIYLQESRSEMTILMHFKIQLMYFQKHFTEFKNLDLLLSYNPLKLAPIHTFFTRTPGNFSQKLKAVSYTHLTLPTKA